MTLKMILQELNDNLIKANTAHVDALSTITENGVANHGNTEIPLLLEAELKAQVYKEMLYEMNLIVTHELSIEDVISTLTMHVKRQQNDHLNRVNIPASSNPFTNAIDTVKLQFLPNRWRIINGLIYDLQHL